VVVGAVLPFVIDRYVVGQEICSSRLCRKAIFATCR
jgi:hypothetical protein